MIVKVEVKGRWKPAVSLLPEIIALHVRVGITAFTFDWLLDSTMLHHTESMQTEGAILELPGLAQIAKDFCTTGGTS